MSQSITVRLPDYMVEWLDKTAAALQETRTDRIITAVKLLHRSDPDPEPASPLW